MAEPEDGAGPDAGQDEEQDDAARAALNRARAAARTRGHAGNLRLRRRWARMIERNKPGTVANTAIARELAGWCWSLATMEE